jgi:hypothetical protein
VSLAKSLLGRRGQTPVIYGLLGEANVVHPDLI